MISSSLLATDLGCSPLGVTGFEYLGNQYQVLHEGGDLGDNKLHVLKSLDLGVTWSDIAQATVPFPAPLIGYTTCVDGASIYILAANFAGGSPSPSGPLYLWVFDLGTDSFTSGPSTIPGAPQLYNGIETTMQLHRRGTGDMFLVYHGPSETVSATDWDRVYVAAFDGSAFTAGVQVGGQAGLSGNFLALGCGFDASNYLHFIMTAALSTTSFTDYYYHVAMSPLGAFGTLQVIETDVAQPIGASRLLDFPGPGGDTIAFLGLPELANPQGPVAFYYALGGSLTPIWTRVDIPNQTPVVLDQRITQTPLPLTLAYLTNTLLALWTVSGVPPGWDPNDGVGVVHQSVGSTTDLSAWGGDQIVLGPFDTPTTFWGASQINAWSGLLVGVALTGCFDGYDTTDPHSYQLELAEYAQLLAPGPVPPPPSSTSLVIQLIGWKMYPIDVCGDAVELPASPSVKRAM